MVVNHMTTYIRQYKKRSFMFKNLNLILHYYSLFSDERGRCGYSRTADGTGWTRGAKVRLLLAQTRLPSGHVPAVSARAHVPCQARQTILNAGTFPLTRWR